ncbi:hypothetical protein [Acinetobacter venetianus]|uniref:hypothetical protein n=1 Tax=Acinetobacter venetianus TaxID=52133 RepID=UPI00215053D6|nr:hypothetical protein [Acinetobacter venetianus]MCR4532751.1 hypothetical protein [Acinetobacter venetianus]
MSKLNLKIVSLLIMIVYSIVVLYLVTSDEGFCGIRFLSIWSVVLMWLLIALFINTGKIKNKTVEEIEKYKKSRKYYVGLFLILMPVAMELPDKLGILLFYNVSADISEMKDFIVEVNGYRKTGTSRQGGKFWAVVKTEDNGYRMICNLIVLADCEYGKYKGEIFKVKAIIGESYPIKNNMIIYEMIRSNGYKLVDYNSQVKLYERNREFIFNFLFFIYIPSVCFSLVVPKFFK